MENYENELENILKKAICNRFNCENYINYIFLRFMILNKINKIENLKTIDFINYLLDTCNLPTELNYKGILMNKYSSNENSISNIINNWILDLSKSNKSLSYSFFINKTYKDITSNTVISTKRYKNTSYYKELFLYKALLTLNDLFKVKLITKNIFIEDIYYPENFKFKNFEEFLLENKINILKNSDNSIIFTEKEVESFLKNNLNKIEPGLVYIDTQFKIKDAFIDILAKDSNDVPVIIELKIKNDERLVWQNIYYPKQFKLENNCNKVRMISLSPEYSYSVLSALKEIKNIEIYEYSLAFKDEKILDFFVKKI